MKMLTTFLTSLPLAAQLYQPLPPQPGEKVVVVRGIVVDSEGGQPLEGATVELRGSINFTSLDFTQRSRVVSAKSNAKGEFSIDAVPGDFSVFPILAGYERLNPILEQLKLSESNTPQRITVRMIRAATVSGIVEDEDGKPVAGISVEMISSVSAARSAGLRKTTKEDGTFSFAPVAPGSYFLRGTTQEILGRTTTRLDSPPPAFAQTYYPNATDPLGAVQVSIYPGVDLPNLRLRMRKGIYFTVSGKVVGRETNTTPASHVRLRRVVDPRVTVGSSIAELPIQANVEADGTFRIERVAPGSYTAVVEPAVALRRVVFPLGSTPVNVTNRDEDNIQVIISPGGVFAGKVVFEDGAFHPGNWQVLLQGNNAAGYVGTPITLTADGSFSLDGVSAGRYQFFFTGPTRAAVSKIEIGGRGTEGSKFDFVVPGSANVVVTASRTGGTLQGTLEGMRDPDKKVTGVASLALVSGFTDGVPVTRTTPLIADGAFSFTGMEPGKYLACAWEDQAAEVTALLQSVTAPRQRLEQACAGVTMRVDGTAQVQVTQTSLADVTR